MNQSLKLNPEDIPVLLEEIKLHYPKLYLNFLSTTSKMSEDDAATFLVGFLMMFKIYKSSETIEAAHYLAKKEPLTYVGLYKLAKKIAEQNSINEILGSLLYVQSMMAEKYSIENSNLFQRMILPSNN